MFLELSLSCRWRQVRDNLQCCRTKETERKKKKTTHVFCFLAFIFPDGRRESNGANTNSAVGNGQDITRNQPGVYLTCLRALLLSESGFSRASLPFFSSSDLPTCRLTCLGALLLSESAANSLFFLGSN